MPDNAPLDSLVEQLRDGSVPACGLVRTLDEAAPTLLAEVRCDRLFSTSYERWCTLDHRGRPWARLLIGVSGFEPAPGDARTLIDSARQTFRRRHDGIGEGTALSALGDLADVGNDPERALTLWRRARGHLEGGPLAAINRVRLTTRALWDGDLHGARMLADEAAALSANAEGVRAQAIAHTWRAIITLQTGHFDVAQEALDLSHEFWALVEHAGEDDAYSLLWLAHGLLHAYRDQPLEGLEKVGIGVEIARQQGASVTLSWTLSTRAEFFAELHPDARLRDAQEAARIGAQLEDQRWLRWARRAEAVVRRVLGERAASRALLAECLALETTPIERPWVLLRLGETEADLGATDAASEAFENAASHAAYIGSGYLEALAASRLAEIDHRRAAAIERPAGHDQAYDVLTHAPARIEVAILGMPRVEVNGSHVEFPTRASMVLVIVLALSRTGALHRDEVIEILWPEAPLNAGPQRLRTEMWRAKQALGPAADHLTREADAVCLDLEQVNVDVLRRRDRARSILEADQPVPLELLGALRDSVAVPWRYEEWAMAERQQNEHLAAQLEDQAKRTGTIESV